MHHTHASPKAGSRRAYTQKNALISIIRTSLLAVPPKLGINPHLVQDNGCHRPFPTHFRTAAHKLQSRPSFEIHTNHPVAEKKDRNPLDHCISCIITRDYDGVNVSEREVSVNFFSVLL